MEGADGSATVDLPESLLKADEFGQENEGDVQKNDENVQMSDGADNQNEDENHSADNNDLREAKRNRRRAKKDLIRKTNQEKDLRLAQLQRENEDFRRRLGDLERNTKAEQIVRIDKNIEDAQVRLEYAKMKLAEATQNNDGQAMVEAQTLWQNANDEVRKWSGFRTQADAEYKKSQSASANVPDPAIQRLATRWMSENSWYDPRANDKDSSVAKKIDELMITQGWDPTSQDYWDELTDRLRKELPHRYNENNDDDSRDVRRPRNVVGSSGREASAAYGGVNRTQFVLSPDRVRAMKEAGAWDNPERKARMIKQFIAYDRQNGVRN
jgi:hypothetical protein